MHFKDLVEKYTKLSAFIHMNRKVKKSKMSIQGDPIPEHANSSDDGAMAQTPASTDVNAATVTDAADDEDGEGEPKSDYNVNDHKRNDNDDHMDFLESDDKGNFNIRCVGAAFQVSNFICTFFIIGPHSENNIKNGFPLFVSAAYFSFCWHSDHRDSIAIVCHLN